MTPDRQLQTYSEKYFDYHPCTGEWFIATNALLGKSVEEFTIENQGLVSVLASRQGFWNESLNKHDIELLLAGTPEQLAAVLKKYKLKPLIDAQLDRPEPYWG